MPIQLVGLLWFLWASHRDRIASGKEAYASDIVSFTTHGDVQLGDTSPYDVRLAQERFPKIHFHPLREHAGLALQSAG